MNESSTKAVIFDVDGTLIDSVDYHAAAWQRTFQHFGHYHPFPEVRSQIGKGGDQLMPLFLPKAIVDSKGEEIQKYCGDLFKKEYMHKVKAFPQIRALFKRLRSSGWRIAVASSAKQDELQTYEDIANVSDLLETETSSNDVEKSKPHPDIFVAAMKRLGRLAPQDCIVVGDSPFDAEAATKAGMRGVGFLCGGFPEEKLRRAGFEAIYAGAAELLEKFEQSIFAV